MNNAALNFNDEFYRQASTYKLSLKVKMLYPLYNENQELNTTVTIEEIKRLVYKTKNGKSCGIDSIPYEVLKYEPIVSVIHSLFQLIFETSTIPSVWRQAILCPILKDKSSDTRVPLNYRGISLHSCISKLYSAFINSRLSSYLKSNDILEDEQNGFRYDRSCEDHNWRTTLLQKDTCDLLVCKTVLKDKCSADWEKGLANFPKLRTYRLIKSEYSCGHFRELNLNRNERSILAQLRCGNLPLR
ncbi:unnamed protein product [Mytilus coruscus]|uniref:Reverse transcriptase domain-containing protein n=1 Tax=Mytilus coruscus TaxID=42192 RepID=A0A6J8DF44_MYTCO|nr:unnamed protein product [Mytilus coruscus]